VAPGPRRRRPVYRAGNDPIEGLAGDVGDELEVLVDVEDGQIGQLRGRRDDEVGHRGRAVLATVGE
jgi:hypothetical protein